MPATKDDVLKALSAVIDPATGRNVVDTGMVPGLVLRDGNVGFAIEVAPERGRSAEPLRESCEAAVARMPGILSVTAVLTAHQDLRAQQTPSHAPQRAGIPGVRSVIAPDTSSTDEMIHQLDRMLVQNGCLKMGTMVVFVAGQPIGRPGTTNLMKLHRVGELH